MSPGVASLRRVTVPPFSTPLDAAQRAIVGLPTGESALVVGAPGSGKTTALLARARALLAAGEVGGDGILMLTPDRRSATELRDRVGADLDVATPGPLARSLASFAFHIVTAAAVEAAAPPPRLLTGADQDRIIADLLAGDDQDAAAAEQRWPEDLSPAVRSSTVFRTELRAFAAQCASLGLSPSELGRLAADREHPVWAATASFLDEYGFVLAQLRPAHRDPAELVHEAALHLASGAVTRHGLLPALRVVLVDDAQELTDGAVALLAAVRARGIAVVAAGDPDIGSGAFRGAGTQVFQQLRDLLGEPLLLEGAHRATAPLTRLAREVTAAIGAAGVVGHRQPPGPELDPGEELTVALLGSVHEETDRIAYQLRRWHVHGSLPWSRLAVIAHDNAQVARLEIELAAREVPTHAASITRPLGSEPVVRDILGIVTLALTDPSQWTPEAVTAALTSPFGGLDAVGLRRLRARLRTAEFARDEARSAEVLLVEAFAEPAALVLIDAPEARAADRVAAAVREAARLHRAGASAHELLWLLWESLGRPARWRERALAGGPDALVAARALDALVTLFAAAKRAAERDEDDVAAFVRDILDQDVPEDSLAAGDAVGAVAVLTPAAAVGREFEAVVVAGLQDGVWPNTRLRGGLLDTWRLADEVRAWRAGRAAVELDTLDRRRGVLHDELRLFLRAITRARRALLVTAVSDDDHVPSTLFGFLPPAEPRGQERHPLTLRGTVARLRRVLTTSTDEVECAHAAGQLALLARAGVAGADPESWYGIRQPSGADRLFPEGAVVPLSPSRIESFERCELDWAVRTLGGDTRSFSAGLGTILHAAMEHAPDSSFETLDRAVEERWGELDFEADWLAGQERVWARTLTRRLAAYLQEFAARQGEVIGAEAEFRLVVIAGADSDPEVRALAPEEDAGQIAGAVAVLSGTIDRVERYPDGRGEALPVAEADAGAEPTVVVVDLKTGRAEKRVTDAAVLEDPQLASYQLALSAGAIAGTEGSRIGGARLLVLSRTLKNTNYRIAHQAPLDAERRAQFVQRVVADAQAMAAASFTAHPDVHCNDDRFAVCRVHTVKAVSAP